MWLTPLRLLLFGKPKTSQRGRDRQRPRPRQAVLRLEALEDRTLLSVFTPTIFTDSNTPGAGSLRDAIIAANADAGTRTDTIQLQAGTYQLTIPNSSGQENAALAGDLDITNPGHTLIIRGQGTSGAKATVIEQTVQDRVFHILNPGTRVIFQDLIIEGGQAVDDGTEGALPGDTTASGGGLLNNGGTVRLTAVVIANNQSVASNGHDALGGGIYSLGGSLTLSSITVQNNQAVGSPGAAGAAGAAGTQDQPDGGAGGNGG
jgi:hypothetical protein